jgi:pimeloyl-ACP methyl ester carboxylesterase
MRPEEAEEMQSRRPDTQVKVIAGAGHDVHLDRPEAVYEAIGAFLRTAEDAET